MVRTIEVGDINTYVVRQTIGGWGITFINPDRSGRMVDGGKIYTTRQAAYRRAKQLNDREIAMRATNEYVRQINEYALSVEGGIKIDLLPGQETEKASENKYAYVMKINPIWVSDTDACITVFEPGGFYKRGAILLSETQLADLVQQIEKSNRTWRTLIRHE